jgi:hypothetical protein
VKKAEKKQRSRILKACEIKKISYTLEDGHVGQFQATHPEVPGSIPGATKEK